MIRSYRTASRLALVSVMLCGLLMAQRPADPPKDLARKQSAAETAGRELNDATSVLRVSYDAFEMSIARARGNGGEAWIADLVRVLEPVCAEARTACSKTGVKERIVAILKAQAIPAIDRLEDRDLKALAPWIRKRLETLIGAPPLEAAAFDNQAFARLVLNGPLGEMHFPDFWNQELSPLLPAAEAYRKAFAAKDAADWDLAITKDPILAFQRGAPAGFARVPAGKYVALGNAGYATQPPRAGRKAANVPNDVWVGLFEVTHGEYYAWWSTLDEAGRKKHLPVDERKSVLWKGSSQSGEPAPLDEQRRLPVTGVLLSSACAYAASKGARLPTEAEWCAAASGKEGRVWPWGGEFSEGRCRSSDSKADGPSPVGSFADGRGPFGHYDLAGNAAEWTASYESGKDVNPSKVDDANAVVRGGSWLNSKADVGTGWVWYRRALFEQQGDVGFRLAMDIPKAPK